MSLPRLDYYLVNAFSTGKTASGNQAAIVVFPSSADPRAEDDEFLLRTAQDFGFAETAYLVPPDAEAGKWGLRWFTIEVPQIEEVKFETRFWGQLIVKRLAKVDENSLEIEISLSTLPEPTLEKIIDSGSGLTQSLSAPLAGVLGLQPDQVVNVGEFDFVDKSLIVEVDAEVDLAALKVDPKALLPYAPAMTIVTQMQPKLSSSGALRTNTRVFWLGYMEDPVTGSAHAFITGYYLLTPAADRIPQSILDGQSAQSLKLDGRQLSRRGGKLGMTLGEGGMVLLSGTATEWGRGTLTA